MGPVGIVWPDVEQAAVDYLTAALAARPEPVTDDVTVSTKRTADARQVIVRDDGGPVLGDIRAVNRLGVTVLAATRDDAVDLAAIVVALIGAWPDGVPVARINALSRPSWTADESGSPELYLTAELVVLGTNL